MAISPTQTSCTIYCGKFKKKHHTFASSLIPPETHLMTPCLSIWLVIKGEIQKDPKDPLFFDTFRLMGLSKITNFFHTATPVTGPGMKKHGSTAAHCRLQPGQQPFPAKLVWFEHSLLTHTAYCQKKIWSSQKKRRKEINMPGGRFYC